MADHSFVVTSNLSQAEAFLRLVDLELVSEWDQGIISSTRTDDLDAVVGRTFDVEVTGFDGAPTTMVYEILEADEPTRFVIRGTHPIMEAVDTMVLTGSDSGCVLDYHGTLELLGDDPPLSDAQLDSMFPKLAAVAEQGLTAFLND
jgi:hypothetical protein